MEIEILTLSSPYADDLALDSPFDMERPIDSISGGVVFSYLTLEAV
jgi:hypothetical protein